MKGVLGICLRQEFKLNDFGNTLVVCIVFIKHSNLRASFIAQLDGHIILMSGDEAALRKAEQRAANNVPLLRKPFTMEELVAALPEGLVRRQ